MIEPGDDEIDLTPEEEEHVKSVGLEVIKLLHAYSKVKGIALCTMTFIVCNVAAAMLEHHNTHCPRAQSHHNN